MTLPGFTKEMPHTLLPTNLSGAYYTPAPPEDFDPNTATPAELIRQGMFWQRPKPGDDPTRVAAWEKAFSIKWDPAKRIAPILEPQLQKQHRRAAVAGKDTDSSSNAGAAWAGVVVFGTWASVTGTWRVPTVTVPDEPAGANGGWNSTSWIGIDGEVTTDVLQAGIEQSVDSNGQASYFAWFEWASPSFKVTLNETSPLCPSIASVNGYTFMTWKGDGNDNINISVALPQLNSPRNFTVKFTSPETTSQAPVLCIHNNQPYVAWTGSGNDNINIAEVDFDFGSNTFAGLNKTTLPEQSPCAPAIASVNGLLYVAWKGDSNDNINVMFSTDNGHSFKGKLTSPETTPVAPCLVGHNGKLIIAWKGDTIDNIFVAEVTGNGSSPTGFKNQITVTETTTDRPALASSQGKLFLGWKGDGNDQLNLLYSEDDGGHFIGKYTSPETSPFGPSLTQGPDGLYIAWKGDGNDNINMSMVEIFGNSIIGFTPPDYSLHEIRIVNFPVTAGDEIVCSVQYLPNHSGGTFSLGNITNGAHSSMTLQPPPGADFAGNSVEWIMERNIQFVNGATTNASLPDFSPVIFTNAVGCSPDSKTTANPKNGIIQEVPKNVGGNETLTIAAAGTVTIVWLP
jgi:Peptidase A4 family